MDESKDKEEKEKPKGLSTSKIRKIYSNRFDAVKQSLKLARKNRRALEEQQSTAAAAVAAGTMSGTHLSEIDAAAAVASMNNNKRTFDLQGFSAIIAISFFSTGFLISMRKYILTPGEFWRQGNSHSRHNGSGQQYHYRTYHNHQNSNNQHTTNNNNSKSNNRVGGSIFDKDHITKHHLTILELPTSNLHPSRREVKDAYRKISLRTHPDVLAGRGGTGTTGTAAAHKWKKYSEERFILATTAHDELLKALK